MPFELIVSDQGDILLQSDHDFDDEVTRVEYYVDTHLLVIGFKDPNSEGELITVEVDPQLEPALKKAQSTLVVYKMGDQAITGFEVPLIVLGGV